MAITGKRHPYLVKYKVHITLFFFKKFCFYYTLTLKKWGGGGYTGYSPALKKWGNSVIP